MRRFYHRHNALMVDGAAKALQFAYVLDLIVGGFAGGHFFAQAAKEGRAFRRKIKAGYALGIFLFKRFDRGESAHGQFVIKLVFHSAWLFWRASLF